MQPAHTTNLANVNKNRREKTHETKRKKHAHTTKQTHVTTGASSNANRRLFESALVVVRSDEEKIGGTFLSGKMLTRLIACTQCCQSVRANCAKGNTIRSSGVGAKKRLSIRVYIPTRKKKWREKRKTKIAIWSTRFLVYPYILCVRSTV